MAECFQRRDDEDGRFMLSELGDENSILTLVPRGSVGVLRGSLGVLRRSLGGNSAYELHYKRPAATPGRRKMQLWVRDFGASDQFSNEGLFAIKQTGTGFYLGLPNPQEIKLELNRVRLHPMELRCEALQWEETAGGVIKKPAAIGRLIN